MDEFYCSIRSIQIRPGNTHAHERFMLGGVDVGVCEKEA
jgi:hypothetical protein